ARALQEKLSRSSHDGRAGFFRFGVPIPGTERRARFGQVAFETRNWRRHRRRVHPRLAEVSRGLENHSRPHEHRFNAQSLNELPGGNSKQLLAKSVESTAYRQVFRA